MAGNVVTAGAVMARLEEHLKDCAVANIKTANALEGLVTANQSMAQAHRDLATELKTTREEASAKWDKLNSTAWKGLGAIGLTILAGLVGVGAQAFALHQDTNAKATLAANDAQVAAQQGREVAKTVGAPIVQAPRQP